MSQFINDCSDYYIGYYRERLRSLQEEAAQLSTKTGEEDWEQLVYTVKRLNALNASVQEIEWKLDASVREIKWELDDFVREMEWETDVPVREIEREPDTTVFLGEIEQKKRKGSSWLARFKRFVKGIWRKRKDKNITSRPKRETPVARGIPNGKLGGDGGSEYEFREEASQCPPTYSYDIVRDEREQEASTGQTEMKRLKNIEKEMAELLNTSKELSIRFCAELKTFEKMIAEKREVAMAAKAERKEERLLAAEEEKREWEEARRHSACT